VGEKSLSFKPEFDAAASLRLRGQSCPLRRSGLTKHQGKQRGVFAEIE
jgi:hypothetical protein